MEQQMEPVELERVRRDATCIIIRVGLGTFELRGPRENILIPESHVAWATVVNDLFGEGYMLVTPDEYAEATGTTVDLVTEKVNQEGTLFAVVFGSELVMPLPLKKALLTEIEV